ncbi:GAF domain-containing sensor histidine kinase [Nocardioides sp.]|uniref:sensor histidine kinase n=1 Tax=Nocardioides sp. TaxID=35761 RepID=UPI002B7E613F|nr:GAF domain-containing sensor histidine kinase [Nocardioides sp.]HXH81095.1 GAF domain-containing sensor histidine kinase [Nocardioides sp.]
MTRDDEEQELELRAGARAGARVGSWGSPADREALRRLADDIRTRAGFKVCAIEAVRGDGLREYVAIAGDERAAAALVGQVTPPSREEERSTLFYGAAYGSLLFVAQEWMPAAARDSMGDFGWLPDISDRGDPGQWQAADVLASRLTDSSGDIRGILYLDEPLDGRRPLPEELLALSDRLELPLRAVLTTIEQERLTQQTRMTYAARRVLRASSTARGLDALLAEAHTQLSMGFLAAELDIVLHVSDDGENAVSHTPPEGKGLTPALLVGLQLAGRRAWEAQRVVIVEPHRTWGDDALGIEHREGLERYLSDRGLDALVLVPLGAGPEAVGVMLVGRRVNRWTDSESAAALDVGHDLGRAIVMSQAFEREQRLNVELQRLDAYRAQMIATISHELMNPLAAVTGHLEMMALLADMPEAGMRSIVKMERGAERLRALATQLLDLARLEKSTEPPPQVLVDLDAVLAETVDLLEVLAASSGVNLERKPASGPVLVLGDANELHRALNNLVNNAVKYTNTDGTVAVDVQRTDDEVVFSCVDNGLGISEADRTRLFGEFFRSTNQDALVRPGTGLGLAIVQRIVTRHHGRVEVSSELGVGTTFRVRLPAADPAG